MSGTGLTIRQGVAALALVVPLLAGCAEEDLSQDTGAQDLCRQYDDVVLSVDELQSLARAGAGADDLDPAVDTVRGELDQLGVIADGRLDSAVATLQSDLDAVREAADAAAGQSLDAGRELLAQPLNTLATDWAGLQQTMQTECGDL